MKKTPSLHVTIGEIDINEIDVNVNWNDSFKLDVETLPQFIKYETRDRIDYRITYEILVLHFDPTIVYHIDFTIRQLEDYLRQTLENINSVMNRKQE